MIIKRAIPDIGGALWRFSSGTQDALRESLPDMPREDRQLLMLRFVREVDQSVDYTEVSRSLDRRWLGRWGKVAIYPLARLLSRSPLGYRTLQKKRKDILLRKRWADGDTSRPTARNNVIINKRA